MAVSFKKFTREKSLNDVVGLGKYQQLTVKELIHTNVEYFHWAAVNTDLLFTQEVFDYVHEFEYKEALREMQQETFFEFEDIPF